MLRVLRLSVLRSRHADFGFTRTLALVAISMLVSFSSASISNVHGSTVSGTASGYAASNSRPEDIITQATNDLEQKISADIAQHGMQGLELASEAREDATWNETIMGYGTSWYNVQIVAVLTYVDGAAAELEVTVTTGPSNTMLLGYPIVNSYSVVGGREPYTTVWKMRCSDEDEWENKGGAVPFTWNAPGEGTFQVKLVLTDADGLTGEAVANVTVNGPDVLNPIAQTMDGVSNGGGQGTPLQLWHKFRANKEGVGQVGPSFSTIAYEWTVGLDGPAPPADVAEWKLHIGKGLESSGPNDQPNLFFHSPDVHDFKTYTAPGNWNEVADEAIVDEYKQWIAIKVPICGDPTREHRFVKVGPLRFAVTKKPVNKVKHVLQQ